MNPEIRTLSVGALTRVEGEGALHVTLTDGSVDTVELNIYEPPRFFEAFLRGRAYTEPPDITARVCGICPVAYQVSACNAIEDACGVTLDPELVALRRLLYCGEWIHSHALHIYLLHAPDFLGYPDGISLAKDRPELIERGLALKKAGNRIMEHIGGRAIHPINVRLGGFYSVPTLADLEPLAEILRRALDDALFTVRSVAEFDFPDTEFDHEFLALTHPDQYPIENGTIARSAGPVFRVAAFTNHVVESQVQHSTALHATLDGGRYLTGPLARYFLNSTRLSPGARQAATEVNIALIFEKSSTRTRCAFEVAAYDEGAHVTYIDPASSQIGHKESMKDTARVLGRMYDAIEYRGAGQEIVEELAEYAGVPVFNGLTDEFHPTQMLADVLTMTEYCPKPLHDISFAFVGDGRNNVANSLLLVGAKLGMDVRIGAPQQLWPTEHHVTMCHEFAAASGARLTVTDDPVKTVSGVDFIYTDVWVSMGEPVETWGDRIELLLPFQVNSELMASAGNPRVKFMHCLPAFHNSETVVGAQIAAQYPHLSNGIEVTEDVFESPANIAFEQAENRMHTIKAVLVAALS